MAVAVVNSEVLLFQRKKKISLKSRLSERALDWKTVLAQKDCSGSERIFDDRSVKRLLMSLRYQLCASFAGSQQREPTKPQGLWPTHSNPDKQKGEESKIPARQKRSASLSFIMKLPTPLP
jgi:hypothetical protein